MRFDYDPEWDEPEYMECGCAVVDGGYPIRPTLDWDLVKTMSDLLAMSMQLNDDEVLSQMYNRLCPCCNPKGEGKNYHAV